MRSGKAAFIVGLVAAIGSARGKRHQQVAFASKEEEVGKASCFPLDGSAFDVTCESSKYGNGGNARYVDTLIGAAGPLGDYEPDAYAGLSPNPAPPFAAIRGSPTSRENKVSSQAYYYHDANYTGFILSRQPAVWMGDLAPLRLGAGLGDVKVNAADRGVALNHSAEYASPFKYALLASLDSSSSFYSELSARSHSADIQYTFQQQPDDQHARKSPYVVLQATREWRGAVYLDPKHGEVSGWNPERMDYKLGPHQAPGFKGYFLSRVEAYAADGSKLAWSGFGTAVANVTATVLNPGQLGRWNEEQLSAYVQFPPETRTVRVRTGMSLISIAQARHNLDLEIPDGSAFEDTVQKTRAEWDASLSSVELSAEATKGQRTVIYTNMFRALQFPSLHSEPMADSNESHYYSLYTDSVHRGVAYQSYSTWDVWRAASSFQILFANSFVGQMVQSMLDIYRQSGENGESGYLPMWSNGAETNIMEATFADSIVAEAIVKDVSGFDKELAWEALQKDADVPPLRDEELRYEDREEFTPLEARAGLTHYKKHGWVAHDISAEAATRTLDYAICDWAVSAAASHLGHDERAQHYLQRSRNYCYVFNNDTGFFAPRFANGSFLDVPLQGPRARDDGFTEGNRWGYLFDVVHDLKGLSELHGGREKLLARLDAYFEGGYNDHSNEPSHHVPALYAALGQPHRSQALVREIAAAEYSAKPDGYGGNEDCGQMSAVNFFWSVLGLYPINPASASYTLVGAPFFETVTIRLPHVKGHELVIRAPGTAQKKYVKSLTINGKLHDSASISHATLLKGGIWVFEMSEKPTGTWAF